MEDAAKVVNINTQRVRKHRAKNPAHVRDYTREQMREWRKNNRARANATNRVWLRKFHRENPHKKYQYNYKLSEADALRLYKLADTGPCELCGATGRMHFDHNHATGKFRGLLCVPCNQGLGRFRDNADLLELAAKYIRERG